MQISDKIPNREIITYKDYRRISQENEFYIWHFLQKNQCTRRNELCSYFENREGNEETYFHPLKFFLDSTSLPYFESYTEESIDFLMDLKISPDFLLNLKSRKTSVKNETKYPPLFVAFNRFKVVGTSLDGCYCSEFFIELTMKLNPKFVLDSKFD